MTAFLAYFLGQTQSQVGNADYTLQIYDLSAYALINSIVIPNVIGYPVQLVRWGAQGIAFVTTNGEVCGADGRLVHGLHHAVGLGQQPGIDPRNAF